MGIQATCDKCQGACDWHSVRRIEWRGVKIKVVLETADGKLSDKLLCNRCLGEEIACI